MSSKYIQYHRPSSRRVRPPVYSIYSMFLIAGFIWTIPWTLKAINAKPSEPVDSLTADEVRRLIALYDKASTTTTPPPPRPTSPATSFVPTEVILPKSSRRRKDELNTQQKRELSASELVQQLSLLNHLLESSNNNNNKIQFAKKSLGNPSPSQQTPTQVTEDPATALQSLALLNALFGQNGAGAGNDELTLALLNANAPVTQAPSQAIDPATAALTNLLISQAAGTGALSNDQSQNFDGFTNSQMNLDSASSNQLSNILGLLGTLGSLRGSSSNLLNLGLPQQQPNFLSSFLPQPAPSPNLFGNMFGGGSAGGNQMQLLNSLLGSQSNSFGQAVATTQPPGVLASLGSLGSSLFSLAGTALSGLSGTRTDGKPRVRGFDTRLGLGYRLGQGADAQMMWEVGPQIFTEPLENDKSAVPIQETPAYIRPYRQQSTQEIQQELQEQLNSQVKQKVQRRYQIPTKSPAEIEHENIGKMLHASPSKYELDYYARLKKQREQKLARQKEQMMMLMGSRNRNQMFHPDAISYHSQNYPSTQENRRMSLQSQGPFPYNVRRTYPNGQRQPMLTNYERLLIAQRTKVPTPEDSFRKRTLNVASNQTQSSTQKTLTESSKSQEKTKIYRLRRRRIHPNRKLEYTDISGQHLQNPTQMIRANYFQPTIGSTPMYYHYPPNRAGSINQTPNKHHRRQYIPHQPMNRPKRLKYNPWQNFIPEADESFNARNAIVTNAVLRPPISSPTSMSSSSTPVSQNDLLPSASNTNPTPVGPSPSDKDFRHPFGDPKPMPSMPSLNSIRKLPSMIPSSSSGVIKVIKSVSDYLFSKEENDQNRPLNDHSKGIYNPTTEPVLIAIPSSPETPLFDPITGKKISESKLREEDDVRIHYGEGLSYAELAKKLNRKPTKRPRIRVSTKRPVDLTYAASGDGNSKSDGGEDYEETSPVPPPGMEMFIDIESGELSIRKPVATLLTFGTTTPRPMTEEEMEDEESGKIFEKLKEHFSANMEEALLSHEIQMATKEHKDKIMSSKDDSAGMIKQFFDFVEDESRTNKDPVDKEEDNDEGLEVPGFM